LKAAVSPRLQPPIESVLPAEELAGIPPPGVAVGLPLGLEHLLPGPELAARLAELDPARVSGYDIVEGIAAWARLEAWVEAGKARWVAEFAHRRPAPVEPNMRTAPNPEQPGVSQFAADEVSARLRIPRKAAQELLEDAVALVGRLPGTLAALTCGQIDARRARAVVDATDPLSADNARHVEERVLDRAPQQTTDLLRRSLRRAVLRVDPDGAKVRRAKAKTSRHAWLSAAEDGMASVGFHLPAEDAMLLWTGLDAHARTRRASGDDRTLDQLRCDIAVQWARHSLEDCAHLPHNHHRRHPHLPVTVAASTLRGLDDDPGALAGYGTIPADVARRIAGEGTWRRLLTEPGTGRLLDYGTATYAPPQSLRDFVTTRDRECTFPTCPRPSRTGELDHIEVFPDGPTSESNLHPPCTPHHKLRHEGGAQVRREADGSIVWTMPTGHEYRYEPQPVLEHLAESPSRTPEPEREAAIPF
jgi:hypothetical protein